MTSTDRDSKKNRYHFDRHTPEYRHQFETITEEMLDKCPVAWTDTYDGHWVAAGSKEVFELARCPAVSNLHDLTGETPYKGITIPTARRRAGCGAACWKWTTLNTAPIATSSTRISPPQRSRGGSRSWMRPYARASTRRSRAA